MVKSGVVATCVAVTGVLAVLAPTARAVNVYVLSSGDSATDSAVIQVLVQHGHTATLGVEFPDFDGMQSLAGFQTVYMQANDNWYKSPMPVAGQQLIVNWLLGGGRLVTSEWVTNISEGSFPIIRPLLPLHSPSGGWEVSATYERVRNDATINAGVPVAFSFPLVAYAGTETWGWARSGATVYYITHNSPNAVGLVGWRRGAGSIFSFSSTCGPEQLQNADFGRLFANVMHAVAPPCYGNCDSSTTAPVLNVEDFTCFINAFAAGQALPHVQQIQHYGNCDHSITPPVLNVEDFTCFINAFASGC
jgi:hypothetical protein